MNSDAAANQERWTQANAEYGNEHAYRAWAADEITWGIFNVPESQLGVLGEVSGLDVVELGCGTAYFSAWLAGRGAQPEAARLLRPGGRFVLRTTSVLVSMCLPETPGPAGFAVDALHELYGPAGAGGHPYYQLATAGWAEQWPVEEIWVTHLAA